MESMEAKINTANDRFHFYDIPIPATDQKSEILAGLSAKQKRVSPKFLYDQKGSDLFDQITSVKEYYPTRSEHCILRDYGKKICQHLDKETVLIEPGSGTCDKVRFLLQHHIPMAYAPIEISKECLIDAAKSLTHSFPDLTVHAICADFTSINKIPGSLASQPKTAFFPGSTIGNFDYEEAIQLLKNIHKMLGKGGRLLIGVDLIKSVKLLHAAYNDKQGITAQFNLNMLNHIGHILGSPFNMSKFEHHAFFNTEESRIEMHLKCIDNYRLKVGNQEIHFQKGETIHTENSYKYTIEQFEALASEAGFHRTATWMDEDQLFSFHCFEARALL